MEQLLCHLLGDYVLQNHWMANRKVQSNWAAAIHAVLYGLPFLFLGPSLVAILVIVITHAIIDRYRLAKLWVRFWGTGEPGWFMQRFFPRVEQPPEAPPFLAVWLLILVDNIMHLVINYLALKYL